MLYFVLKSLSYKPYNCPQKNEFCRLFLQKEMIEFWHKSADKLLEVLPTYHWTDSLIIESVLLDWGAKKKYL